MKYFLAGLMLSLSIILPSSAQEQCDVVDSGVCYNVIPFYLIDGSVGQMEIEYVEGMKAISCRERHGGIRYMDILEPIRAIVVSCKFRTGEGIHEEIVGVYHTPLAEI